MRFYNGIMKRYRIIFKGTVQGVGFRWHVLSIASELNMTGYVRNLSDGNVEAEVQGQDINEFVRRVTCPDRFIDIEDYVMKPIDVIEGEKRFSVRY